MSQVSLLTSVGRYETKTNSFLIMMALSLCQVLDSTVITQSNVSCSCSPDTVSSTSATSGSIQVSYGQFPDNQPSPQVNLSVSYQNGACSDTESTSFDGELS